MDATALEVTDLRKRYGALQAVDGVSFSVHRGEVFGILGPNGAGKTTTVECIEGLRQPDSGHIVLLGEPFGATRPEFRQRIGIQLQTTGLYPKLTVREIVRLFSSFYHPGPRAVIELVGCMRCSTPPAPALRRPNQRLSWLALLNVPGGLPG